MKPNPVKSDLLNASDVDQLQARGISAEEALCQIRNFQTGFPFVDLVRPCTPGDGLLRISEADAAGLTDFYEAGRQKGRLSVFVPASGAATRMFKPLFSVYHRPPGQFPSIEDLRTSSDAEDREVLTFWEHLPRFGFHVALEECARSRGLSLQKLVASGNLRAVLEMILSTSGLGYENLPKGLIPFHAYPDGVRTPFEEHLVEAALYALDAEGKVRLHFTVPEDFLEEFRKNLATCLKLSRFTDYRFEVSFSCQKPSTDTLAVEMDNSPFRDRTGKLLFRPAGHGAILENLQDTGADVVYIKNIDNVLVDRLKPAVVRTQKMLAGFLMREQQKIHGWLRGLDENPGDAAVLERASRYALQSLGAEIPHGSGTGQREFLRRLLNRPIRVCGMVPNVGEPGGGPFWVRSHGSVSRQIVEKSQVDLNNPAQKKILDQATHFNPVNLACGLRDYQGRSFDLSRYVDPATGFISIKSKDGRHLKALERPGLWNGAMADWITFFVETPLETFGPVKQVHDLLRPEHQEAG